VVATTPRGAAICRVLPLEGPVQVNGSHACYRGPFGEDRMIGLNRGMTNLPTSGSGNRKVSVRKLAGGIAGLAVLYLLLVLPAYTDEFSVSAFLRLPIELPILLLVLFAAPAGVRRWIWAAAALLLGGMVALKVANLAVFAIYARPFNAFLHLHLVPAGIQLLSAQSGRS